VAMLGISRHCQEIPFLVNLLVANAVKELTYGVIQDIIADRPQLWSDAQLRDLAHAVAGEAIDWRRGFTGESLSFEDVMQRFYTDDGHGDGRLAFRSSVQQNVFQLLNSFSGPGDVETRGFFSSDGLAMLVLPAANLVVASRKDTTEVYRRLLNSALLRIETPLWQQQDLPPYDEILTDQAGPVDRYRYMFVRLLVPAYEKLRNKIATIEGERDGVLIGLALELYHRDRKSWPTTLDELSPRWLPAVPLDRITGQPLGYKIVDDRPLVYSLGKDGGDDGGRRPFELTEHTETYPVGPPDAKSLKGDWVIWSTVPSGAAPTYEGDEMGTGSE